jgi:hypothetical protein
MGDASVVVSAAENYATRREHKEVYKGRENMHVFV